jgi:hypothetical protein
MRHYDNPITTFHRITGMDFGTPTIVQKIGVLSGATHCRIRQIDLEWTEATVCTSTECSLVAGITGTDVDEFMALKIATGITILTR